MIIVQLQGGTGNQLFQYALGYKLAKLCHTSLGIDTTRYANAKVLTTYTDQNSQISSNAKKSLLKDSKAFEYIRKLKKWFFSPYNKKYYGTETIRTYRLFNFSPTYLPLSFMQLVKLKLSKKLNLIEFPDADAYIFDPKILDTPDNTYVVGFWQSHKYFEDIADEIKKEFTVSAPPTEENERLLEQIQNTNSVVIHIRRGDYLKPVHSAHHGLATKEYYNQAIKYIKERVENPHFFLFSDEPDWAKENIKTDAPTEVSYNTLDMEYEDIRLMYSAKHFIIANSSFSWWGAWLSKNKDKIVIAPKQWLANTEIDTKDAIPEEWIRI